MSKSPEFPTILLVTGWAVAVTVGVFVAANTGKAPGEPVGPTRVAQVAETAAPAATAAPATGTVEAAPAATEAPAAELAETAPAEAPAAETAEAAPAEAEAPAVETASAETAPAPETPATMPAGHYGLGRAALPAEVEAWDVAVLPDGTGLPEGSGDVLTGDEVFAEKCASCHGDFAEGLDAWPVLAGGIGSLTDPRPVKTIGSYWPHLSTVFDYVHRSMPFGAAQTVTVDETYAITAFLLYSNGLVEDDFVLSKENFTEVTMPNADGFYVDDREASEYALFRAEPCMQNCREGDATITKRAIELNVTPEDPDGRPAGTLPPLTLAAAGATAPTEVAPEAAVPEAGATEQAATETAPAEAAPAETAAAAPAPAEPAPTQAAPAEAAPTETVAADPAPADEAAPATAATADPALIAAGEKVFKKCSACHKVGDGARNAAGPVLNGVVGRSVGTAEGFKYSDVMAQAGAGGMVWDHATLDAYLADPKGFLPKNKMSFAGLKTEEDRAAVIAYLASFGG